MTPHNAITCSYFMTIKLIIFLGNKPLRRDISKIVLDHGGDYRVSQKVGFKLF